ncbi:MAG: hypothetical protein Q7Q71_00335 [Verrucomicrobiota bacterium JB023]|nr:hypothetical protein [Verrucomicrobiota bacterium JB023]
MTDSSLLAEHLVSKNFTGARQCLVADAAYLGQAHSSSELMENEELKTRLLLHSVLKRLPTRKISSPQWLSNKSAFLDWLFLSSDRLELLLNEIRPEDDAAAVLDVWSTIWNHEQNPEFREKYASLALALALVFDNPRNARPKQDDYYYPSLTLLERYDYFVQASEDKRLDIACDRLIPRELIHVVDLKISQTEIDWSLRKVNESRRRWGQTYGLIEYLMERAVENVDPYEQYILSEILKEGGICGDQAYFSAESGKARGIPATYVAGVGNRGGHAWVAFMPDANEWATYGSQGITNGKLYDPQRGRQLPYDQLVLEADKDFRTEQRVPALLLTDMAREVARSGALDLALPHFEAARELAPMTLLPWQEQLRAMRGADSPEAIAELGKLVDEIERDFRDFPSAVEYASEFRREHLLAKLSEEELQKELEREIRRQIRKYGDKGDVVANSVASLADMLVRKKAPDTLRSLYRTSFRKCGEDLELFKKLMESYLAKSRSFPELRKEAPRDLERYYERQAETRTGDYFRGMMEVRLHRRIARAYRGIGEKEKADSLIKKIERREEKLAKSAL